MKLSLRRKSPFVQLQYEPDLSDYTEKGTESGAKLDISSVDNPDVIKVFRASQDVDRNELWPWLIDNIRSFDESTVLMDTDNPSGVEAFRAHNPKFFYSHRKLNEILHLNRFLRKINEELPVGGYLMCHARTAMLKKQLIMERYPRGINKLVYFFFYLWHRVCPKLGATRWLYFALTKGRNRTYHRVEVLGRLYRAGFEVLNEGFRYGEFFVLARKVKEPISDQEPNCGAFIKLNRVGKGGELIGVYKFRTMYSYSEYLQPYIYAHEGLQDGGKFADDYRVNEVGRIMRRYWLDELPMFINFFKGQLKLVGVRPLSKHYFSLYSPEMKELRIKVKPGLLPPFYYERSTPRTIEDVQASERRYIESYLAAPLRTDWRYFWGSVANIIFRRKRSK